MEGATALSVCPLHFNFNLFRTVGFTKYKVLKIYDILNLLSVVYFLSDKLIAWCGWHCSSRLSYRYRTMSFPSCSWMHGLMKK